MPQLHLYVPEEIAEAAKARAEAAGKTLSAYLSEIVRDEVGGKWPRSFFENIVGGWKGSRLKRPRQPRLERRDRL